MATIELTKENLDSSIQDNDILLIDFWADWCGPCKMFGPIFEKVADQYPDVGFAKLNTEDQQEVAAKFAVRSIPTLGIFREGILVFLQAGALPENALVDIVEKVQALDMDEVRQKIAEEESKQSEAAAPA
jgi:thioredoxin